MKKRQWLKLFLGITIFIIAWVLFIEAMYIEKKITCAHFYGKSKVKGTSYLNYKYTVEGKTYDHSVATSTMKVMTLEDLKSLDCIKIEHSVLLPSINRVIDERILR